MFSEVTGRSMQVQPKMLHERHAAEIRRDLIVLSMPLVQAVMADPVLLLADVRAGSNQGVAGQQWRVACHGAAAGQQGRGAQSRAAQHHSGL